MSGRTTNGTRRTDAGGVEKKAWASGRVLTAEQRQRKQEVDRRANRFLKKEVQDRLALLEARMLQLESSGPKGESKDAPAATTPGTVLTGSTSPASTDIDGTIAPSLETIPAPQYWDQPIGFSHDVPNDTTTPTGSVGGQTLRPSSTIDGLHANRIAPHPQLLAQFTAGGKSTAEGRELTLFLNHLVDHIRNVSPDRVCYDDEHNQDVIISAVLKGWKFALSRYEQICPLWEVLQMVDLCLFKECNMIERVSCLRMLHKRYMFETKNVAVQVEGPLPAWFQPQVTESLIAHEPVIDHLTWPKLRERMMSSQTDMLTNKFWALFARNLRVAWQFEPFDIMAVSPRFSLYHLSNRFESGLLDMANWRMDINFFYDFPGLADDIPAANYMPLTQIQPRFGLMERTLLQQQEQQRMMNQQRRGTYAGELPPRTTHAVSEEAMYETTGPVSWNNFYT